jgi:Trimethylamine:corrinoid methyltransferase
MPVISREELDRLHQATVEVLSTTGVEFSSPKARRVFQDHGFRVEAERVFIEGDQLSRALETVPGHIRLRARNSDNDLAIGGQDFVLGTIGGAPNFIDEHGHQTRGTTEMYGRFCRLVQTSEFKTLAPHSCCYPADVDLKTSHLDMIRLDMTLTDRVMLINCTNGLTVGHCLDILDLIFGGRRQIISEPCAMGIINPFSPLRYANYQSEALMMMAANNQAIQLTNQILMGLTGPVSLPAALVVGNAELMGGIVLAQLVRPGVPIIYGSTSCPIDMQSMTPILGSPETMWLSSATLALGDYYGLPSRTGGSLTDSHQVDAQAFMDGALLMYNALAGGAHFIQHALGCMSSYMAASLEKLVMDEEMARMIIASFKRPVIDEDSLNLDLIRRMGSFGNYLIQPETLKDYRGLFRSRFIKRLNPEQWRERGRVSAFEAAKAEVRRRLASYVKPPIDSKLEAEIDFYVASAKKSFYLKTT